MSELESPFGKIQGSSRSPENYYVLSWFSSNIAICSTSPSVKDSEETCISRQLSGENFLWLLVLVGMVPSDVNIYLQKGSKRCSFLVWFSVVCFVCVYGGGLGVCFCGVCLFLLVYNI